MTTTVRSPARKTASVWRITLGALALLAVTSMVWIGLYRYFVADELARAEARLSLYRSTVLAEVERFAHLTEVLTADPFVMSTLRGANPDVLNRRFARVTDAAGLDALFLMRPDGLTISASNAGAPGSFLGENYGFRPYFQQALAGQTGTFYGIGATTGLPGYFIADPVRDNTGAIIGVVALKISLEPFEASWRAAGEQVLLTDRLDVVLLSSDPAWRYRSLDALSPAERATITAARQFPGQALDALDWSQEDGRARIDGVGRLHRSTGALPHGWQLHLLTPDDPAVTRATLGAGGVVGLAAAALLLALLQRGRRLGAALRRSEEEEEALRRANTALAQEIDDRRRAERRLQETREELGRASRLAALGQLAASVTHELGQPIAAMRNHLAAAEMSGQAGPPAPVITGLVDRMEGITRQLKFFARSDGDTFADLDLRDCIAAVLDLMAPSLAAEDIRVAYTPVATPLMIRGAQLRIEQVLTNLMRNAMDAMEDADDRALRITAGADAGQVWVEVADTGHGLGDATLSELKEPFVTTRASGQGMGLGLAISAGILSDHRGHLDARNRADGGAAFRMILPAAVASPQTKAAE